jgi:AraC-like DNA-binding protein
MILDSRFADRLTLAGIARTVGCSPYHLARTFRREAGLTIHRYLNRLRLRAGLERLVDGAEGLTGIALDVGFSSHAHFTEAFRREFGLPPSAFRRDLTPAVLRQMSKNLKADGPPTPVSSP